MLSFPAAIKVYLCTVPCDMRRSFDGLSMMAEHVFSLALTLWILQRGVPLCKCLIDCGPKELVVLFETLHVTRRLQDPLE